VLFTHFFYILAIAMASMVLSLWGMYTYYYKWDRYSIFNKRRHAALGLAMGAFIWIWMVLMTGIDTYMVTGGGPNAEPVAEGNVANFGAALSAIFNPMYVEMILHRTFANLSWPAFALAAWAAFRYMRSKSAEDKAFYDWASSLGLTWGVGFLMLQPFVGFAIAYALKAAQPVHPANPQYGGAYDRLMGIGSQAGSFTSHLLYFNLILVVALFILSGLAMDLGAVRHPDRGGRVAIRAFGVVGVLAGLYSISPIAMFPVFWARYIALAIMAVATFGAFVAYVRGRFRFRYGSPGRLYRLTIMALGILAATTALSMGLMKSNSRYPYTVYNQPGYMVTKEVGKPPTNFGK
jgi:cytochrome bd-type quinol oxidase subunit 1